jgi:hypothetical protein
LVKLSPAKRHSYLSEGTLTKGGLSEQESLTLEVRANVFLNMPESVSRVLYEESGEIPTDAQPAQASRSVLAVFEPGRAGEATLREAAELAESGSELSVVTLAPQARPCRCCSKGGTGPYNIAVRDEAEIELRQARDFLGTTAGRASFTVLVGQPSPPLAAWAAAQAFDLILLPSRRFTRGGNPFAKGLRRATSAEVRLLR